MFSSTCATYGDPQRIPISEDHGQHPVNPYGESKLMVERLLHSYEKAHDFSWIALRYFNAAGADPDGELGEEHDPETHLIPLAVSAAMGLTQHLEIYGTGSGHAGRNRYSGFLRVAWLIWRRPTSRRSAISIAGARAAHLISGPGGATRFAK